MHRLAHLFVAAEGEGEVGDAARNMGMRTGRADLGGGLDKGLALLVMLFQAGGDRVSLNSLTDTPAGVAGTAVTDGSGNTTVTLHDGSTITFIGISTINNTFFTTH